MRDEKGGRPVMRVYSANSWRMMTVSTALEKKGALLTKATAKTTPSNARPSPESESFRQQFISLGESRLS